MDGRGATEQARAEKRVRTLGLSGREPREPLQVAQSRPDQAAPAIVRGRADFGRGGETGDEIIDGDEEL